MAKTVFVSAGWPYLYEIPGLHNCIPMLWADVIARYQRWKGNDVVYVSGADEHGSRVEFIAEGHGRDPASLVDEKYRETVPLLAKLGLSLDAFARTSDPGHKAFVSAFLARLFERRRVVIRKLRVPYCAACDKHLPDRFTEGACPRCQSPAFGNQCNNKRRCGAILDPFELVDARCAVCGSPVESREREHLVLPLDPLRTALATHIERSYAVSPTIRDRALASLAATREVVLTRDSSWGVPLPPGMELPGRSVYSWVDSLLGKVSAVAALGKERQVYREVFARKLFFLGADGVGFYAVLLPALLMAAEDGYALDGFRIATNDVLIYEGGICSKSTRNGIWLPEALGLLPADEWRFVIFQAEAEAAARGTAAGGADLDFRWDKFARDVNDVLGGIGKLYQDLAGAAPRPEEGAPEVLAIEQALDALEPGRAFGLLVDALRTAHVVPRPGLAAAALPLLACFLPHAAERAMQRLEARASGPMFPELPLDGAALRKAYTEAVGRRLANRDLTAEMADLRADALCVCPARLTEG